MASTSLSQSADREQQKTLALTRMRRLAAALLLLMLALLVVSVIYQQRYPHLQWLRAFAEAAVVGGVADWFAVVALFRHPMGIPLAHTAIVARRKNAIGAGLGRFVARNFLTHEHVLPQLRRHNAALALARWLCSAGGSGRIAAVASDFLPSMLAHITDEQVVGAYRAAIVPMLARVDAAPLLASIGERLMAAGDHQKALSLVLAAMHDWLQDNQGVVEEAFAGASKFTPRIVDHFIVGRFATAALGLIDEVQRDPQHPLRSRFDDWSAGWMGRLRSDPALATAVQAHYESMLRGLGDGEAIPAWWRSLLGQLERSLRDEHSSLRRVFDGVPEFVGQHISADVSLQEHLNSWWSQVVASLVVQYRDDVAMLISEVVASWDAEQVSRKIELEIGADLQYIRLNGTLFGGCIGLALHAVFEWLPRL